MGTSLSGLTPATTFDGLLKTSDNDALDATLKTIGTGDGTDSVLQLSNSVLQIGGTFNVDGGIATFKGVGSSHLTSSFIIKNSADAEIFRVRDDQQIFAEYINGLSVSASAYALYGADYAPNIRVNIKGSGATSATTSLLVQNSAGSELLKVTDDGVIDFGLAGLEMVSVLNGGTLRSVSNREINITQTTTEYSTFFSHIFETWDGTAYSEAMRITGNTDQFVGIGEITPTARLHIKGSGNDATTTSLLVQNSDATELLKVTDDASLSISGNTEIDSSGLNALIVKRNGTELLKSDGSGLNGALIFTGNLTNKFSLGVKGNDFNIWDGSYLGGGDLRFSILADGKTGIGAQTPTAQLHIKGSGATSATTALLVQNSAGTEHLKVTDDGAVNVRQNLFVNHPSVSSRSLKLGWGSIYATDNSSELSIGAVLDQAATAPRIVLGGKTRASGADAIQVQTLNGMYIATTAYNEDPSAQLQVKGSGNDATTTALLVQNSDTTPLDLFKILDDGTLVAPNLPTSATGLPTGAIYNDAGTLKIV